MLKKHNLMIELSSEVDWDLSVEWSRFLIVQVSVFQIRMNPSQSPVAINWSWSAAARETISAEWPLSETEGLNSFTSRSANTVTCTGIPKVDVNISIIACFLIPANCNDFYFAIKSQTQCINDVCLVIEGESLEKTSIWEIPHLGCKASEFKRCLNALCKFHLLKWWLNVEGLDQTSLMWVHEPHEFV